MSIPAKYLILPFVIVVGDRVALGQPAGSPAELARTKATALELCVALQQQADLLEEQGQPSGFLRRSLGLRAGLDDAQQEVLLRVAARLRARVTPLDQKAQTIIQAARQKYPGGRLQPGELPPPLPRELVVLQQQRDMWVDQAVQELDQELGSGGVQKLTDYLIDPRGKNQAHPGQ